MSLAMALIAPELTAPGTEMTCHIVGQERPVKVMVPSPYVALVSLVKRIEKVSEHCKG